MHLLEAALAWVDSIAGLCMDGMIEPATGALREFFTADWTPAPSVEGLICEPRHHGVAAFSASPASSISSRRIGTDTARIFSLSSKEGGPSAAIFKRNYTQLTLR